MPADLSAVRRSHSVSTRLASLAIPARTATGVTAEQLVEFEVAFRYYSHSRWAGARNRKDLIKTQFSVAK